MSALTVVVLGISTVPLVVAAVLGGSVLVLSLSLLTMTGDKRSELERRLADFGKGADTEEEAESGVFVREQQLAETRLMQDMVTLTGRLADRIGLLNRVESRLEQADLPLRPPEALFFYMTAVVVVALFSILIFSPIMGMVLTLLAFFGPLMYLSLRRRRRLRKFEMQLPSVLNMLSGSMRAGFSFAQGLEAVAEEASEPSARELQRVHAESRLGRPIEDALEDSASRMQSVDLMWAVMAIRIQREVGGNLAELLDTVSMTMTQRERMRREILALTAEGRMSAWVLGVFPPMFAALLFVVQPGYMNLLFSDSLGVSAVIGSTIMAGVGFLWLRKIMQIEV
jgi:tight adherence protein B